MMHLDRFVFLCPNLTSSLEEGVFTFTGEEAERCFQPILGSFEISPQPFRLVTFHTGTVVHFLLL